MRAHPDDLIFTWASAKTLSPNKATFTGTRAQDLNIFGDTVLLTTPRKDILSSWSPTFFKKSVLVPKIIK